MAAKILDGNAIAAGIRGEVAEEVQRVSAHGFRPGLAAVLVGNDPASEVYVRNKVRACEEVGLYSEKITPPESSTTEEVLSLIDDLNGRDNIDGILVQLPLPRQIDAQAVLLAVSPEKDVDGLHPLSVGRLQTRRPGMAPCTPAGVIEILQRSGIRMRGAHAVILGRSDLVGKPVAMLLLHQDATVTICHSQTRGLEHYTREADILVCATGKAGMVTPAMVKPGGTVIDVGINKVTSRERFDEFFQDDERRERAFQKNGYVLMGDCDPRVAEVAGNFTPVPGGVGPLTIAMLLSNTVKAAKLRRGLAGEVV
ncbi:MAG: bifunctional 5,10-methylenetetrahydrofolate dehydrogenase/5,10-methenyltetrahydrofolate cyclohydrolase [Acidobacteriaceae bacterium]